MLGRVPSELFVLAVIGTAVCLTDRLRVTARRLWAEGVLRPRHAQDDPASPRVPYRAAKAPPPDSSIAKVQWLRHPLATRRVVAAAAGLALFGLGHSHARPLDVAEPRPRPERRRPPATVPPSPPSPGPAAGLPFDPIENPPASVGQHFAYPVGLGGYQVPMRFVLPARHPSTADEPLLSATLELDVRLRVIPDQVQGTEGIWIDGVLSGTTWPPYRVPAMISRDLSGQNVVFTDAVTRCCREQLGRVSLPVAALLEGSGRTVESALADGRLDVDIADDVEVYGARLVVCRRASARGQAPLCTTVGSRSLIGER